MKHQQQGASASIVVISILFLALMAALGVVFYQNFISPKTTTPSHTTSSSTSQTSTNQTAQVAFNSAIYALDYPSGWTATSKPGSTTSTVTITNSSGTVQVALGISSLPVTESCDPGDGLLIHDFSVSSTTVTSLVSTPLYAVEAIFDAPGGGYQYIIGLAPDGGDTQASVGSSHCDVASTGIVQNVITNGQTVTQPTITATITFPKLPVAPKAATADLQPLKDLVSSNDYKTALTILESARKE